MIPAVGSNEFSAGTSRKVTATDPYANTWGSLKITRSISAYRFKMTFVFNIEDHQVTVITGLL